MVVSVTGVSVSFDGRVGNQSAQLDRGHPASPHRVMDDVRPPAQRIERLTPLADVLTHVDELVTPIAPISVSLGEARGRVLATDIATGPHPLRPLALRDGYAVGWEETSDAGSYAPAPLSLAVRVEVGAPLPEGADAVTALDAVDDSAAQPQALASVTPGEGVLPRAQDADGAEPLLRAGTGLGNIEIAVLAALGTTHVSVRAPAVKIINTRQDLVSQAIASMLITTIAPFAQVQLFEGLDETVLRSPHADLIIVVGGSGTGERDRSVSVLARAGRVVVHGVGLSPGETTALGLIGTAPLLIVPGRLDAALADWHVIGAHILRRLTARSGVPQFQDAKLARKIASTVGLVEFVPVCADGDAVTPLASGYLPWRALLQATGYVLVPASSEGFAAGAIVRVTPL
jgi:molybdopterin molybdotransferase